MRATIMGFHGSWGSGIAILSVRLESGEPKMISCENAPTVRALEAIFGNVITSNHCVNVDAIKGKKINYKMDDMGLVLGAIMPDCEDCNMWESMDCSKCIATEDE